MKAGTYWDIVDPLRQLYVAAPRPWLVSYPPPNRTFRWCIQRSK
ncbi:MAG: hypothetical protein ABSH21_13155 [Verrucomicrobiia bacterium]|jgi:hypothetical protein